MTITVTDKGRKILLPDHMQWYEHRVEARFDIIWDSIDEDETVLDFTEPRLSYVSGYEYPILLPSFTESMDAMREYLVDSSLEPGDTVIDGGSFAGLAAIMFQDIVGFGKVITVEPDPVSAECTLYNLNNYRARKNVAPILVRDALWSSNGSIAFTAEHAMGSSATEIIGERDAVVDVPTVTLSSLAERFELSSVALVKLDIEGAEVQVLRDSEFFDKFHPRLVIECHEPQGEPTLPDVLSQLRALGYDFKVVEQSSSPFPLIRAQ
jgi:FkbM family methyltransferase